MSNKHYPPNKIAVFKLFCDTLVHKIGHDSLVITERYPKDWRVDIENSLLIRMCSKWSTSYIFVALDVVDLKDMVLQQDGTARHTIKEITGFLLEK